MEFNATAYLRQKLAKVADLYMKTLDLFLYCFLIALFSIDHPDWLIVLHLDLSRNHHITTVFIPDRVYVHKRRKFDSLAWSSSNRC